MKHILKLTLLLAALMCCGRGMAYGFWAANADGKVLYYAIMSSTDLAVVHKNGGYNATYSSYISGDVTIPSTVTYNGTTYTVTSIGEQAFNNCSELTSVIIPSSVTSIGGSAFWGCSMLTSVNIPSGVTSINSYTFAYCRALSSITIPASVTSIGNAAFYDADNLRAVTILGFTPPSIVTNGTTSQHSSFSTTTFYVHAPLVSAYMAAGYTRCYALPEEFDVTFTEKQTASSYKSAMKKINKNRVTSVAFFGGVEDDLTEALMKQGMNPNCLYFMPKDASIHGANVVSELFTAEEILLTDDNPYCTLFDITAQEVSYVHNPSVWANGRSGWETICLPFAPDDYHASEAGRIFPIVTGGQGNFWLRKFVGSSDECLFFSSTSDGKMEANTPYIVAFPGASMGKGHLQGQTITFSAKNVTIPATVAPHVKKGSFTFVGNYDVDEDEDVSEGWKLDDAGSAFSLAYEVGDEPFRAYFVPEAGAVAEARALRIEYVKEDADGVLVPEAEFGGRLSEACGTTARGTFDLQGRRVAEAGAVKSGLYIRDGHKVVVR